jgi:6-phosphofructokinase 1|eukprot:g3310.t1
MATLALDTITVPSLRDYLPSHDARSDNYRETGSKHYANYIADEDYILADIVKRPSAKREDDEREDGKQYFQRPTGRKTCRAFLRAGPRQTTYFDRNDCAAAIVTCGGLCPGLNDVVYHIVSALSTLYGVKNIFGIRGGWHGFYNGTEPLRLTERGVSGIQHEGGTILGAARGGFEPEKIFDAIKAMGVNLVFIIGGDGTHRGALRLHEMARERKEPIAFAGIPKTIDNDIGIIDRSFGFESAVEEARRVIKCAKTEAACAPNGVGIVKLMGRHAGFIAVYATLASSDVDLVLIPELPLDVDPGSPTNCLDHVRAVVRDKGHAVVVVAEGAGADVLLKDVSSKETNAAGVQPKLPPIGEWIKKKLQDHLAKDAKDGTKGFQATVKYIDPSYIIRSVPANAADSIYSLLLAQNAVHGSMAGYSGFSPGLCNNRVVFLPIDTLVNNSPRGINPNGRTIERILSITHQPLKRDAPPPPAALRRPFSYSQTG